MLANYLIFHELLKKQVIINSEADTTEKIYIADDASFTKPETEFEIQNKNIKWAAFTGGTLSNAISQRWFRNIATVQIDDKTLTEIPSNCFTDAYWIKRVILHPGITKINSAAFQNCNLEEINLESVTVISDDAFNGNYHLNHINIQNVQTLGNNAFKNSGLIDITIPKSLTGLGISVFQNCQQLTYVKFDVPVESFGMSLFQGCSNLRKIDIDTSNLNQLGDHCLESTKLESFDFEHSKIISINQLALYGTRLTIVRLPSGLGYYSIKDSAFSNIPTLKEFYCPNDEKDSIQFGTSCFLNCINLETFDTGNRTFEVTSNMFKNCISLKRFNIELIKAIREYAFRNCVNLSDLVKAPTTDSLEIDEGAFINCINLEDAFINDLEARTVTLSSKVFMYCSKLKVWNLTEKVILNGNKIFSGCNSITDISVYFQPTTDMIYSQMTFYGLQSLKSVNVLGEYLDNSVFDHCLNLEKVSLAPSIKHVGSRAFAYCNIKSIDLSYVTEIELLAFAGNPLTEVIIHHSYVIDGYIFSNCHQLTKVTIKSGVDFIPIWFAESAVEDIVLEDADSFTIKDKIVYDKNMKKLVAYPSALKAEVFNVPESVYEIGRYAFMSNKYLKTVNFLGSVFYQNGIFLGCTNLENVNHFKQQTLTITYESFFNCTKLKHLNVSIVHVEERAFMKCDSLAELKGLESCTKIMDYAFYSSGIEKMNLASIVSIARSACSYCSKLKEVLFGDSVTSIEEQAFFNTSIKSLNFSSKAPTLDIGVKCFSYCLKLKKIYVLSNIGTGTAPFTNCPLEYAYFSDKVTGFNQYMFRSLASNKIVIEFDSNNPSFYVMNDNIIVQKGTNIVMGVVSLNDSEIIEIPEGVTELTGSVITGDNYNYEKYTVTRYGSQVLKIPSTMKFYDQSAIRALRYLYTICYDGTDVLDWDYSKAGDPHKYIVKDDYPYDRINYNMAYKEKCDKWVPPDFLPPDQSSASIGGNVFGLSKKEMFMIIVIVIVSGALIALSVYFLIYTKKLCKKKNANNSMHETNDLERIDP